MIYYWLPMRKRDAKTDSQGSNQDLGNEPKWGQSDSEIPKIFLFKHEKYIQIIFAFANKTSFTDMQ